MTRGSNKAYTQEFREQAMNLVRVQNRPPTQVARELGMPFNTLLSWLKKAGWVRREEGAEALPEDVSALRVRVGELERQLKRSEMEKEILKKATAFFAGQSQ